jgi:putative transcriptional regulator
MGVSLVGAWADDNSPSQTAQPLVGQLLVASPSIGDAKFFHAVVLMIDEGKDGAMGLVINQPVERLSLTALMAAIGHSEHAAEGDVAIYAGGPVQPDLGFVIHSTDYRRRETRSIDEHLALTTTPDILFDIGQAHGPRQARLCFGYTGWGPGQLEKEMQRGDWVTAPEDPDLVFGADRDEVWTKAWNRRTINL